MHAQTLYKLAASDVWWAGEVLGPRTDALCETGVLSLPGTPLACCAATCGVCNEQACDLRPGGSTACCPSQFTDSCSASVAPCMMRDSATQHATNGLEEQWGLAPIAQRSDFHLFMRVQQVCAVLCVRGHSDMHYPSPPSKLCVSVWSQVSVPTAQAVRIEITEAWSVTFNIQVRELSGGSQPTAAEALLLLGGEARGSGVLFWLQQGQLCFGTVAAVVCLLSIDT